MAQAIAARSQGDDYQARWFWLQVCRLFQPRSKVMRVGYEVADVKSLDDVAVYYGDDMPDEDGHDLRADYFQVKFHVTGAGSFTWERMMDPAFINAESVSLLQRLRDAQRQHAPDGRGCRFYVYSPWPVDPNDLLARVYSRSDDRLLWSRLSQGGPGSRFGKLRAVWRAHLGIDSDEELERILRPVRIRQGPSLAELQERLNERLLSAGLEPIGEGALASKYDDLPRKLLPSRRTEFTRPEMEELCHREGLWRGQTIPEPTAYRIGVRSFLRWAEQLEDETDTLLDLTGHFDGRHVRSPDLWNGEIFPEITAFLSQSLRGRRHAHLHLHAHATLAFATGYALAKAPLDVAVVQLTARGQALWRPEQPTASASYPGWAFTDERLNSTGSDVAIGLSVRHDVKEDVRAYAGAMLPQAGRIIWGVVPPGPAETALADGAHAHQLAQALSAYLRECRTAEERRGALHIFASAPNGLLFFMGRLGLSYGRCVLYEYDLEANEPGGYAPSLALPLPPTSAAAT